MAIELHHLHPGHDDELSRLKARIAEREKENESLKYSVATLETDLAMSQRWRKCSEELPEEGVEGGKMKTLTLSLKKQWFDMIKAGVKKEEYREIKARYFEMFCDHLCVYEINKLNNFDVSFHLKWPEELGYDRLVFTLGYPKADDTERRLIYKNPKIRIGTGRTDWGAEPGKLYFVISWEE